MKSDIEKLRSRGYIKDINLEIYKDLSEKELLKMLNSEIAIERTISARLILKYKELSVLESIIKRLTIEKKLYTKIALSESIAKYGEKSSKKLVKHLVKVGNNQHRKLPNKKFKKKNYPLPRDIIGRTLCNIGKSSLKSLKDILYKGEYSQILEAIDAIGYISYYEKDYTLENDLLKLMDKYKDDDLMTWKLLRALQSFNTKKSKSELRKYINSDIKQHKWEAIRSLEQIDRRTISKNKSY